MIARARNTDIECLRAIAVLGVALHHTQDNLFSPRSVTLDQVFKYADFWFGVDLFFAISGFVIASSLLPKMQVIAGCPRAQAGVIGGFWIRRAWRLLPSAWLWLAIILFATICFNQSHAFGSVHANVMASLAGILDVANVRFMHSFMRYEYGASFVYWSLSLEEQFYLLFPLLVALFHKRIALVMLALFFLQLFMAKTPFRIVFRTDAIALGVLLATAQTHRLYGLAKPSVLSLLGNYRIVVPVILLATLAFLSGPVPQQKPFVISAIAIVSAIAVWIASYDANYLLSPGTLKRMLVWVGGRSYAIYLIHVPVYFFLREICFRTHIDTSHGRPVITMFLFLSAAALTCLLADLNFRFIEQPLRNRGKRIAERYELARLPPGHLATP